MRDQKRIQPTLKRLELAWMLHPDLRLGQVIVIATSQLRTDCDPFYVEDDEMISAVESSLKVGK